MKYFCFQVRLYLVSISLGFFFFLPGFIAIIPNRSIGLVGKVFANGLGDKGSIPGRVIPKTLVNTQHYKVRIKGKVEQSR